MFDALDACRNARVSETESASYTHFVPRGRRDIAPPIVLCRSLVGVAKQLMCV